MSERGPDRTRDEKEAELGLCRSKSKGTPALWAGNVLWSRKNVSWVLTYLTDPYVACGQLERNHRRSGGSH